MNNIFGELRKYARKNHPILTYDGRELYERIAEIGPNIILVASILVILID